MRRQCQICDQWFTSLSDASVCLECLNPPKRDWMNEETPVKPEAKQKKICIVCKTAKTLMLDIQLRGRPPYLMCVTCTKLLNEVFTEDLL